MGVVGESLPGEQRPLAADLYPVKAARAQPYRTSDLYPVKTGMLSVDLYPVKMELSGCRR